LIGERSLAIIRLLLNYDVFTPRDVYTTLELGLVDYEEIRVLPLQRQIHTERVTALIAQIEDILGDAWDYETNLDDDDPLTVLQERVDAVLLEYEALEADVDEI